MSEKTDEDLVRAFLEGQTEVYEILFNRYYKKVYNLCLRFCNFDANLAEEWSRLKKRALASARASQRPAKKPPAAEKAETVPSPV